jgi:H+/gluconate symporter-like permease
MIILIGLIVLIVAAILAVAGVGTNMNSGHPLSSDFAIFGQHLNSASTGQLFLYGIIVGIFAALGLGILYGAFLRRLSSRRLRRELKDSRGETTALRAEHDRLTKQLEEERIARLKADAAKAMTTEEIPPFGE